VVDNVDDHDHVLDHDHDSPGGYDVSR